MVMNWSGCTARLKSRFTGNRKIMNIHEYKSKMKERIPNDELDPPTERGKVLTSKKD